MSKVKTVQVDNRLIIADGVGPLRYLDLDTNKVHVYKPPKVGLKRRILKLFRRQPFEDVLFFHKDGFKVTGTQPNLLNILETRAENICLWYDGTMRPHRGHHGDCTWKFDGQVYWHDVVIARHGFVSPRPPKIYDIEKGEQPIAGIKITGVNKVTEHTL